MKTKTAKLKQSYRKLAQILKKQKQLFLQKSEQRSTKIIRSKTQIKLFWQNKNSKKGTKQNQNNKDTKHKFRKILHLN